MPGCYSCVVAYVIGGPLWEKNIKIHYLWKYYKTVQQYYKKEHKAKGQQLHSKSHSDFTIRLLTGSCWRVAIRLHYSFIELCGILLSIDNIVTVGDWKDAVLHAAFVEEMESIVKFIGWRRSTIISSCTLKVFPLIFYNQEIITISFSIVQIASFGAKRCHPWNH